VPEFVQEVVIEFARKKDAGDPTLRIVLPDAIKPAASL
jgi:hypothetical protein